jgi:uncharacterized membrane protein YdfJ with MMPL/SSD domain
MLRRTAALTEKRYRIVLGAWLVLTLASVPFAAIQSTNLVPGDAAAAHSQSARVEATLRRSFPQIAQENTFAFLSPTGAATGAELSAEVMRIARESDRLRGVAVTTHDREIALFSTGLVSPILLPIHVAGTLRAVESADKELVTAVNRGAKHSAHLHVYLVGQGTLWSSLQTTIKREVTNAEVIGVPALLVILLLIFGSVWAAALPVALGISTLVVSGMAIYALSTVVQLSIFVTDIASLIGLGVAVDYSLIILTRVREELATGADLAAAQEVALVTSGRAVIFSGLTVMLSLCGLWLIPDVMLRSMAVGAAITVFIAVLLSVVALPALIRMLGARRVSARRRVIQRRVKPELWQRWTYLVTRRPLLTVLCATSILLLLAVPALHLRVSTGALQQLGKGDETRVGFEKASTISGSATLDPIYVVATAATGAQRQAAVANVRQVVSHTADVKEVGPTSYSQNGHDAVFTVVSATSPESARSKTLVRKLRQTVGPVAQRSGVDLAIGGATAIEVDQEDRIAQNMWKAVAVILALSLIILTVLFRSVLLPVKAVAMNLLTVAATYGVLVAVFQWGWADSLFGFQSLGYLETLTPPLVLAVVFGLSMDYEIFLLSRIREHWDKSHDPRKAVANGLSTSARTITSAAMVLVCVFAVFVAASATATKEVGLGGAVAIGLDVTVVRLTLVPALMTLFGRWNWWWPKFLDDFLPAHRVGAVSSQVGQQ